MEEPALVTVHLFGSLYDLNRARGLPQSMNMSFRGERTAREIAGELRLPLEQIAAVYRNHVPGDLGQRVLPGDRIAFVPHDVPGPHRVLRGFPAPQG